MGDLGNDVKRGGKPCRNVASFGMKGDLDIISKGVATFCSKSVKGDWKSVSDIIIVGSGAADSVGLAQGPGPGQGQGRGRDQDQDQGLGLSVTAVTRRPSALHHQPVTTLHHQPVAILLLQPVTILPQDLPHAPGV